MRPSTLPPKLAGPIADPRYRAWIAKHYPTRLRALGACQSATEKMVAAFPELKRVRGYRQRGGEHWWCETADGSIVDPTAAQYDCRDAEYYPIDESKPQPTGYCRWCKGYVFQVQYCSDECRECYEGNITADLLDMGYVLDASRGAWVHKERLNV